MNGKEFEEKLSLDLKKYLVSSDKIDERFPECPDLEELWKPVAKAYIPDGIREFNDYPTVSLGWMMFIGMAFAKYWDEDWEKYSKLPAEELYKNLRDPRGYDNMDDYILSDIIKLDKEAAAKTAETVGECAARTLHSLKTSGIEPGTEAAARSYIDALHQLYLMGIATELKALGYHMTPLGE